jgi:hypothetical protein
VDFSKSHYDTRGPFDLPMKDSQAKALEKLLPNLPEGAAPKFVTTARAQPDLMPGERADISWISTEDPDRDREVIIARGMDDSHFKLNPIVTLQHCYYMPPVGKSIWRKKNGDPRGIKAKTQYPRKPDSWTDEWPPDVTFTLIQSGLLLGKSIGFLPLQCHTPSADEIKKNPDWANVTRVIDQWLLLEYACVYLPCQQNAVVEAVSKGLTIPQEILDLFRIPSDVRSPASGAEKPIPFTAFDQVEKHIEKSIQAFDFERLARKAVQDGIDRARGRV